MNTFWKSFFGFAEDGNPHETYEHAVSRAKQLIDEGNYEDACRILRYAEQQHNPEAMFLYGWCYWKGQGIAEDAGKAVKLWKKSASLGYEPATKRCEEIKDFIATI